MNTLYLYEDEATSKDSPYGQPKWSAWGPAHFMNRLRRGSVTGQVVLVMGEGETCSRPFPNGGIPFQGKLILLLTAKTETREGLAAVEEGLERSVAASFFISSEIFSKIRLKRLGASRPCGRNLLPMKRLCRPWKIFWPIIIRVF